MRVKLLKNDNDTVSVLISKDSVVSSIIGVDSVIRTCEQDGVRVCFNLMRNDVLAGYVSVVAGGLHDENLKGDFRLYGVHVVQGAW
jgi:hypothetical protein